MTDETLDKAKQIKFDIEALKKQTISVGISNDLIESWKLWLQSNIARLQKEFEEL